MRSRRLPSRLRLVAERDEPLVQLLIRRGSISPELARAATARGGAFVRGRRVRDPDSLVRPGDRVEVTLCTPDVPALERERILHLDELVLAVDKPAGVAAQEDLAGGPALPELCSALLRETGERQTQALLVHRLDRGTTGVTVLARARRAQAALLAEFRAHRVRKEYRALVAPAPSADEGLADTPVESRPARTHWRVLERFQGAAAVAAMPETGRTHQIRLHMAALGSPLLGDKANGGAALLTRAGGARHDFSRPMLHALSLELRHPLGGELRVAAPLPADFQQARDFLAR
ncbi:MAG TPA: pseudouridine synthase [Myxococcales bacterium]|nr:pseudouridine synthase [Myxococcales bacterium]